tara:strand:- start:2860 stop:3168 length:309 start_codon:yes stop_codon:yes gene_type:complete
MSYIQKSKIKSLVRDLGFRISPESFDGINRAIEALIKSMLNKVEADGMKTLMNQHTGTTKASGTSSSSCKKCANIKPEFLKFARNTQVYCHDEAYRLSKKLK